jgi:hypothetical protein
MYKGYRKLILNKKEQFKYKNEEYHTYLKISVCPEGKGEESAC